MRLSKGKFPRLNQLNYKLLIAGGCAAAVLVGAAGCTTVSSTRVLQSPTQISAEAGSTISGDCTSSLGSYSLAYSTLTITIKKGFDKNTGDPKTGPLVKLEEPKRYPDPKHVYCLNLDESITADDDVRIAYGTNASDASKAAEPVDGRQANGLLSVVMSKSVDQTGTIIRKIIRAIFIGLSDNGGFPGRSTVDKTLDIRTVASIEFNPFDDAEIAELNLTLKDFGLCLTMGRYTFDTNKLSPSEYCDNANLALQTARSPHLEMASQQQYLVDELPVGIYYRPRQNYPIYLYGKDDPDAPDPSDWTLLQRQYFSLENISPILSIGVKRRIFAESRMVLAFDDGALVTYCLSKGSEFEGAMNIPLDIIYGIAQLPAATVKARVDLLNKKQKYLAAQDTLIKTQNSYIEYLTSEKSFAASGATAKDVDTSISLDDLGETPDYITPPSVEPSIPDEICKRIKQFS